MLSRSAWSPPLLEVTKLPATVVVGFSAHKMTNRVCEHGLLNEGHPFVQWLIRVRDCCTQNTDGLTKERFEQLAYSLETPIRQRGYKLPKLLRSLAGAKLSWAAVGSIPARGRTDAGYVFHEEGRQR
jgi:hypothetical protein